VEGIVLVVKDSDKAQEVKAKAESIKFSFQGEELAVS
jgi:hypothetical protein